MSFDWFLEARTSQQNDVLDECFDALLNRFNCKHETRFQVTKYLGTSNQKVL